LLHAEKKNMSKSKANLPHPGRGGNNVSLAPLTPDQAISGMFKIKPADVKRIVASKPGNGRKKK
jgi:hypothetical protein